MLRRCVASGEIDKSGRDTPPLIGAAGMSIWLASAGLALLHVLPDGVLLYALIGFIAVFALSTVRDLVRHQRVLATAFRARGSAVGARSHAGLNAVIATVCHRRGLFGERATSLLPAMMAVQFMVVLNTFPGTKSVPLEA